ncbi:hypothetical protein [Treponema denticola]|jgi:lipoprotein|uniref:hypothetical protein n=1 Tax=Treponema denticola TaxID=158 RepID=UPI0002B5030D|nr:hypothetical protein [Treponema denticola]EMB43972.1 hypothetical protein HMPREF9730_01912 [Treponema denticola AL-2]
MKKMIIVILTVITLLASCASTDFFGLKSSNNDLKSRREITENQDKAGIDQVIITYYVKGVGGNIAVKIGETEVKEATQIKHSISIEKGTKITFIAYPEDNYKIDMWSGPFANTSKQSVDLVVVENVDIYVMFKQKDLASASYNDSSRTIHTGPRGGKYYINKNGKKTYIKKNKR